jgi:hypothetical protein
VHEIKRETARADWEGTALPFRSTSSFHRASAFPEVLFCSSADISGFRSPALHRCSLMFVLDPHSLQMWDPIPLLSTRHKRSESLVVENAFWLIFPQVTLHAIQESFQFSSRVKLFNKTLDRKTYNTYEE